MQFAIEATVGKHAPVPNVVSIGEPFSIMGANASLNKVNIKPMLKNSDWQRKLNIVNVQAQDKQSICSSRALINHGSQAFIQIINRQLVNQSLGFTIKTNGSLSG